MKNNKIYLCNFIFIFILIVIADSWLKKTNGCHSDSLATVTMATSVINQLELEWNKTLSCCQFSYKIRSCQQMLEKMCLLLIHS